MFANPTQAPRSAKCRVCELVAAPHMLTLLLYDENLNWLPLDGAVDYQREVGLTATERQLEANAKAHRHHVEKWMRESEGAIAPALDESGIVRIPPLTGPVSWADSNQQAIDLGHRAGELVHARMEGMKDSDVITVWKAGAEQATTRAGLELKGQIKRAEALARLASGRKKPFAEGPVK